MIPLDDPGFVQCLPFVFIEWRKSTSREGVLRLATTLEKRRGRRRVVDPQKFFIYIFILFFKIEMKD